MAEKYARIIGTEEDKVNCPFYYKIGACRHGDQCSRTHLKPFFSQTIVIPHMYVPPPPVADPADGVPKPPDDREQFEDFFEEIVEELGNFGEIEELHVLENLGDHMWGNVYCKFSKEEEAEKALQSLSGRYYAGRLVACEYSPVTNFREARCRQFEESQCVRGGYCNFMHIRHVPGHLRRALRKTKKRKRSRSRSRGKDKERRRERSRSRSPRKDKDRRRSRSRDRDRDRKDKDRDSGSSKRSSSEERRAKIASWNKAKEAPKDEPEEVPEPSDAVFAEPADVSTAAPSDDSSAVPAESSEPSPAEPEPTPSSTPAPTEAETPADAETSAPSTNGEAESHQ